MIYGSVCSGIEAATVAWKPLGWRAAFVSEIEPFPRAVLKHHHPETPLHGDFTTIKAGEYEPIDLLVGGTPCQSFSVAGLRGGLGDGRGNLALEYLRLAGRLGPRWVVWENVPGVFSSTSHTAPDQCPPTIDLDGDHGPADGEEVVVADEYDADEDHALACFLAGLSELGYGLAYRVLDAQFTRTREHPWAVPQRRRRLFVVGYLGDWRRAAAVLFDGQSLSGDPAPRRKAGQIAAPTISARPSAGGGLGTDFDLDGGLIGAPREGVGTGLEVRRLPGDERGDMVSDVRMVRQRAFGGNRTSGPIEVATAVSAHGGPHGRQDFESETFVVGGEFGSMEKSPASGPLRARSGDSGGGSEVLVAHTLKAEGFDASEDGTGRGEPLVPVHCFDARQNEVVQYGPSDGPLDTDGHSQAICFSSKDHGQDAAVGVSPTLRSGNNDESHANAGAPPAIAFALRGREGGAMPEVEGDGTSVGTLRSAEGGSSRDYIAFDTTQMTSAANRSNPRPGDPCHPLTALGDAPAVAFTVSDMANGFAWESDVNPTLNAHPQSDSSGLQYGVRQGWAVRRLTPRECERLQGFPDDYTLIPWRGGMAGDGPRYKALGNSMATNVMRWLGERIALVDKL